MKNTHIVTISIMIAILNFFDGLFTYYGITYNYIDEANPIMKLLIHINPILFLMGKFFLSIVIIVITWNVANKSYDLFKKYFSICLLGLFLLYSGIFSVHIFWISQI